MLRIDKIFYLLIISFRLFLHNSLNIPYKENFMKKENLQPRKKLYVVLIIIAISLILLTILSTNLLSPKEKNDHYIKEEKIKVLTSDGINYIAMTDSEYFYTFADGKKEKFFIKGVNIGAGKPGAFPGEVAVTYDEYYRWFEYISQMNANTIRVYTILRPQFYNALYDFNQNAEKNGKSPIYLIHGVWVNEEDIAVIEDAFGEEKKIQNGIIAEGKSIIDILHGNCSLPEKKGHADGNYTTDVSNYVIGWILGIEWEPAFVIGTNENNPEKASYKGKYLFTDNASPFEAFLCEVGDSLIQYETEKYSMQRPVALSNWVTTDPLAHPNEPYKNEDIVTVNVEHIKWTNSFKPGMFASYHVYPYYPDTFNYQKDYVNFIDEDGKPNPYKAYLREINKFHSMPVLIGEFGIPASRGKAHENIVTGYNQGFIDEKTQGDMVLKMMTDIHSEGLAGGLIFSWQDEWFKRTWNNSDLDLPDSRPYWSNVQTNEQRFGLLAFDTGNEKSTCYIDGDFSDWSDATPIYSDEKGKLSIKSDEAYVYVMADVKDYDFNKDTLLIPVDTIPNQGNLSYPDFKASFSDAADFVIKIQGESDSRVLVDAYYDNYYFRYAEQTNLLDLVPEFTKKNTGLFNPIRLCITRKIVIPPANTVVPFKGYETGSLKYGISNPNHPQYNSLNDFYYKDGKIEMRIPWQLFNVMDPAHKIVIDDMHGRGRISPVKINGFKFGLVNIKSNEKISANTVVLKDYSWDTWELPTFHERLKPSYYILQKGLLGLN